MEIYYQNKHFLPVTQFDIVESTWKLALFD